MKKYVLTSPKFDGSVLFGYSSDNNLIRLFNNEAEMNDQQNTWLLQHLPYTLEELEKLAKRIDGMIQEIPQDLSFDIFWDSYGRKVNLKRCKPLYEALSEDCKLLAITRIKTYFKYCERTGFRGIADPDKYLRSRYFETDWTKER